MIADNLTFPIILKPVAGGGGKGMVVVEDRSKFMNALDRIDLESTTYYIEKYIADARHIEVQIMADHYGHVIHLGERECSLQRRNQKILEEAPSTALTSSMRKRVGELAIKAAKSINYTNVGTVEFLLDKKTGEFYFMEINPRIQVEHGITETITGIDIVRKQIRIAAGEPLNIKQEDVRINGHAIECRINAEDAEMNFMPCPGYIEFYHQPGGPYVRVDSGVCAGSTVPPYYDSLVAKVIVHGRTRGDAIRVMKRALREFHITGIKTLRDFHLQVLANPQFCSGDIDTQFIGRQLFG
jgi:acetyl-CoA carboxylase biotin carboxylase subunit